MTGKDPSKRPTRTGASKTRTGAWALLAVHFVVGADAHEHDLRPLDVEVERDPVCECQAHGMPTTRRAAATVRFGIAENPLVQFCGAQFTDGNSTQGWDDGQSGGIVSNEWRLVVVRGRIAANNVTVSICGYNASSKFVNEDTTQTSLWHSRTTFAKNARLRLTVGSLMGIGNDGQPDVFTLYGFRVYRGWFDDATIERMRDLDAAELQRRGM